MRGYAVMLTSRPQTTSGVTGPDYYLWLARPDVCPDSEPDERTGWWWRADRSKAQVWGDIAEPTAWVLAIGTDHCHVVEVTW